MAFLDLTIVNIAFPDVERTFAETSRAGLSWVLNAYNIVFAALLVPAGRLADVVGRRRVFLAGIVLFTAASIVCAAAPTAEVLIAGRVAQAAGGAALIPTSIAFLLAEFPLSQRAMVTGLWSAAAAVAAATGPALGGVLIEVSDWRAVFLVNLPIGAAVLALALRLLHESEREAGATLPDFAGVVLVTLAVGALALGIVEGDDWGWGDGRTLAAFAAAALLTPLLVRRSLRHPSPVIEVRLFRVRSLAVGNVGTLLFSTAFYAMVLCHVLFLVTVWRYSVLEAGLAMTPAPLCAALLAGPGGKLADRYGQRVPAVPGALLFAAGCLWFVRAVGTEPAFVSDWLVGAVLTGAGVGLAYPSLGSAALAELPAGVYGLGSALNAMFRQIGAVLGVAVLVAIVGTPAPAEAPAAFDDGWTFSVVVGASAALAGLALGRVRATGAAPGAARESGPVEVSPL